MLITSVNDAYYKCESCLRECINGITSLCRFVALVYLFLPDVCLFTLTNPCPVMKEIVNSLIRIHEKWKIAPKLAAHTFIKHFNFKFPRSTI